ncbi:MAG: AzlC family ABC transporter permease [Actinobacteria bacterium]|nr:AzlC family ABC transporter permease [Actinomycetota bacterium]
MTDELKQGLPAAAVLGPLAFSFSVLARAAGWDAVEPIVFSVLAFSGSGQLGALAILSVGGSATAAVAAASFLNLRFLPMGVSVAPALSGGRLSRFVEAQALTDASWVAAARLDGTFDRRTLLASGAVQYVAWVLGAVAGALVGPRLVNPDTLGLDAVFPAFFLALLADQVRDRRAGSGPRPASLAALAALLTLALVPVAPPGIPIVAGAATALLALASRPRWRAAPGEPG